MTNELSQHGSFNIGLQDIHDSTVNVTQILGKSLEYKDLTNQLQTQQELFAYIPEDDTEKRLRISQAIAQLTAQIEQFKADVTRLAHEFNRIEINTDRLRRAKEHFEQGEIAAARAVFDSEREQMQSENNRLVQEKERFEQAVLPKLYHARA
jgi:regulator of replication initiation timing